MLRKMIAPLLCLVLAACVSTPANQITVTNTESIKFSGKGAGAGMMMSASMGAMGIAIGFAIDTGIAKEIEQTAQAHNIVIDDLVIQVAESRDTPLPNNTTITIERFGFVSWPGKGDLVAPQLYLSVAKPNHDTIQVRFPDDFQKQSPELIETALFYDIKTNHQAIQRLWLSAAKVALAGL